ncbi:MAG: hypothetical protein ACKO2K_10480, partial [Alphaproteobacteria bacterium]
VEVVGADAARARLDAVRDAHPGRKLVVFYWIEDVLPMMVADVRAGGLLGTGADAFRFACDDSLGGRVAESLLGRLGRRTLSLRWRSPGDRVRDLQRILRSSEPMGIAVDGHGPYGRVGDAFPRLVESARAIAVPVAAIADRSSWVWARAMLAVPRHGARLAVAVGEAVGEAAGEVVGEGIGESARGRDGRDMEARGADGGAMDGEPGRMVAAPGADTFQAALDATRADCRGLLAASRASADAVSDGNRGGPSW